MKEFPNANEQTILDKLNLEKPGDEKEEKGAEQKTEKKDDQTKSE
jgi:hypothetical protein